MRFWKMISSADCGQRSQAAGIFFFSSLPTHALFNDFFCLPDHLLPRLVVVELSAIMVESFFVIDKHLYICYLSQAWRRRSMHEIGTDVFLKTPFLLLFAKEALWPRVRDNRNWNAILLRFSKGKGKQKQKKLGEMLKMNLNKIAAGGMRRG